MTWEPTTKPWIVCAAIQKDEHIICGPRHWDTTMHNQLKALRLNNSNEGMFNLYWGNAEQGFIDQFGRFYTREEAMQVARQNKQIIVSDEDMLSLSALHSEDLY
jgi:hypothetical protein